MHINQNHWAVLVLNFIKKEVQILDSLGGRDKNKEKALVNPDPLCIPYHLLFIKVHAQIDQNSHVCHHLLGARHTVMHRCFSR